jgi:hypothetical protein
MKHNSIAYHQVCEGYTAGTIQMLAPTGMNISEVNVWKPTARFGLGHALANFGTYWYGVI